MYTNNQTELTTYAEYDEGLRKYMLGVYNHMTAALALSGLVAYLSAPILAPIMQTNWSFVFALMPLGFVLVLSFGIHKLSNFMANFLFYAYAIAMGFSLSTIFMIYTTTSITKVFFITAATFAAASLYGYATKKDLSGMNTFLIMGVVGLIIASIVNIFLASSMMNWIISMIGVLIFTTMTAFDSQNLKNEYLSGGDVYGFDTQEKSSIFGALTLYLNFVLIFQYLLNMLGQKEE